MTKMGFPQIPQKSAEKNVVSEEHKKDYGSRRYRRRAQKRMWFLKNVKKIMVLADTVEERRKDNLENL